MSVLCRLIGGVETVDGDVQLAAVPNVGDALRVAGTDGLLYVHHVTYVAHTDALEHGAPYVELLVRSQTPGLAIDG